MSARLKEMVSLHYLEGRYADSFRKVAWVTSGAPVEFLKALGFFVHYPENHGAVCGVRRRCEEIAGHAESQGYSPDLCSYARTDLGTVLSGITPVGRLPRPDLLLCCTNICQTVLSWYRILAEHFQIPLIRIDTPFLYRHEPDDHLLNYVLRQLEDAMPVAEAVAGRRLDWRALQTVTQLSKDACELWLEILRQARHRPVPMSAFDQFILMGPIVELRGERKTVDFYAALLLELDRRVSKGIGAIRNERHRILWDNLPIWFELKRLSTRLAEAGVVVAASTYTNAWGELAPLLDTSRPMESMARVYTHAILNRSTGQKLNVMRQMVKDYSLDGAILHSDRSCKPYSMGQIDQCGRLLTAFNMPTLLLEADHNDPRAFGIAQGDTRLQAFLEMLDSHSTD